MIGRPKPSPRYTPPDFVFERYESVCGTCGVKVLAAYGSWIDMEAAAETQKGKHICGVHLPSEAEVKRMMARVREVAPDLSFEDQCKVYNRISKGVGGKIS